MMVETITDPKTNIRYFSGPEIKEVRKVIGREIKPVEVRDNKHPGQAMRNERMEVYPSKVEKNTLRQNHSELPEKYSPAP